MNLDRVLRRSWQVNATSWIDHVHGGDEPNRREVLFPTIAEALRSEDARVVLDAGCGEGSLARYLLDQAQIEKKPRHVDAVDYCQSLVQHAARRDANLIVHDPSSSGLSYYERDITALDGDLKTFPARRYDAIVCNLVLHCTRDATKVFAEFARLLKPGGVAVIVIHDPESVDPSNPEDGTFAAVRPAPKNASVSDAVAAYEVKIDKRGPYYFYFHRTLQTYRLLIRLAGLNVQPHEERPLSGAEKLKRTQPLFRVFIARPIPRVSTYKGTPWITSAPTAGLDAGLSGIGRAQQTVSSLRQFVSDPRKTQERTFEMLEPIVSANQPSGDLYILLSGNAFLLWPQADPVELLQLKSSTKKKDVSLKVGDLKGKGVKHPLILCPGDLIGEFELLGGEPYSTTVFAGLPWNPSQEGSRVRVLSRVQRIPHVVLGDKSQDTAFRQYIHRHAEEKIRSVVHLLAAFRFSDPTARLRYLLWAAFGGDLPVAQYCLQGPAGTRLGTQDGLCLPVAEHRHDIARLTLHRQYIYFLLGTTAYKAKNAIDEVADAQLERDKAQDTKAHGKPRIYCFALSPGARTKLWQTIVKAEESLDARLRR